MAKKLKGKKKQLDYYKEIPKTKKEAIAKAERYLANAKETINTKTSIEHERYKNAKYVSEASGMAYLAAVIAIKGYLLETEIVKNKYDLPKRYDQYTFCIRKIPRNGKLMDHFNTVYENLHVAGYYEGFCNVNFIKGGFESARKIIDMLSA